MYISIASFRFYFLFIVGMVYRFKKKYNTFLDD